MSRYVPVFVIVVFFTSCTRSGYYYTDKNGGEEYVSIFDDGTKKLGLSANIIDTNLNVVVYFILLDTSKNKGYSIESINVSVNNVTSAKAIKTAHFIDRPLRVKYEKLTDIINLDERIYTGLPLELYFEYDRKDLSNEENIRLKIDIVTMENGQKKESERMFELVKRTRYRHWRATK